MEGEHALHIMPESDQAEIECGNDDHDHTLPPELQLVKNQLHHNVSRVRKPDIKVFKKDYLIMRIFWPFSVTASLVHFFCLSSKDVEKLNSLLGFMWTFQSPSCSRAGKTHKKPTCFVYLVSKTWTSKQCWFHYLVLTASADVWC